MSSITAAQPSRVSRTEAARRPSWHVPHALTVTSFPGPSGSPSPDACRARLSWPAASAAPQASVNTIAANVRNLAHHIDALPLRITPTHRSYDGIKIHLVTDTKKRARRCLAGAALLAVAA